MRVLFLGLQGDFTRIVLERLLAAGAEPCALILSGPRLRPLPAPPPAPTDDFGLPLLDSFVEPSALHLAWQRAIPVYESGPTAAPGLTDVVRALAADVACVACFDRLIPPALLALPRHGFLNVHPSLLPAFRGPEPIFWQVRQGVNPVGVTVHWMDAGLDTGDIAAQTAVELTDGLSVEQAERLCAGAGGDLLAAVLADLAGGRAARRAQPAGGSYQPAPGEADFAFDTGWSARRAFNFMRGTAGWGLPYRVTGPGGSWLLTRALAWGEEGDTQPQTAGEGVGLLLSLADGWLLAEGRGVGFAGGATADGA